MRQPTHYARSSPTAQRQPDGDARGGAVDAEPAARLGTRATPPKSRTHSRRYRTRAVNIVYQTIIYIYKYLFLQTSILQLHSRPGPCSCSGVNPEPAQGGRVAARRYGLGEAWTLLGRAVRLVATEDLHASLQVEERGAPAQDGARVAVLHIA